ncbi:MAG: 2-C-methyl-D-erythritol 4-phosphate cytidylyltransferase [Microbacter sp.]
MRRFAVIVAGGKGIRMNSPIPKQFIELRGKPVLMRSIEAFADFDRDIALFVVIPADHFNTWYDLCDQHHFNVPHHLVEGGNTRFESVSHALDLIHQEGVVAVHDGVRPLVSRALIQRCYETAEKMGSAIPTRPIVESLRQRTPHGKTMGVDRADYFIVQTPQVFNSIILKAAYRQQEPVNYSDDASLIDHFGIAVNLVEGERRNIKITDPIDLKVAEWVLSNDEKGL